jgi:hypothetical protein
MPARRRAIIKGPSVAPPSFGMGLGQAVVMPANFVPAAPMANTAILPLGARTIPVTVNQEIFTLPVAVERWPAESGSD